MAADPFYGSCARKAALGDHTCERDPLRPEQAIEWEHALYAAGKQLQQKFAIIPLCWWAHRGPGLDKDINIWIALSRATDAELLELSNMGALDYFRYRRYLIARYGVYNPVEKPVESVGIAYGYLGDSLGTAERLF